GSHSVFIGNSTTPIQPVSGKLAGLLETSQQMIPAARELMQEWTSAFVSGANSVQATGLSTAGPTSLLSTSVGPVNPSVPLAVSNSLLPVGDGILMVTMTNAATGERQNHTITINSQTDSLQDVIDQLEAIPRLRATLAPNGQLVITSEPGYLFDFAGRPESQVDTSGITGTAVPAVSGSYFGEENANWTLTASTNGQIGVTEGLKLIVTDSVTGQIVKELNVGAGYPIGQPLEIANGFAIRMEGGTLAAGDTFDVTGVSDPDSAGFLAAFGIGGLFQTTDLRSLTVAQQIVKNPALVATGRTGEPGDGSQMNQLVALREAPVLANGTETIEGRLATITSNIGVDVNQQSSVVEHLQAQYEQLRNRQDAISGVDPNEELLAMMQFQRSFQANARFLSSVNSALDDLLGLLR
ncbi:MAG TPA: flagellar basal body rod C-terminal domain-containing protein, partial [Planctomicrobium sp.]|nr:flagellar basal body rod C-terminal domain-containing protein [Planctomicrobium sp.]